VDRNKGSLLAFKVGDRSFASYLEMALEIKSKYKIKHLCTDGYDVYSKFKISDFHHTTKKETCLVESFNGRLRDNLTRFNRRTKRFSKSLRMLKLTILMFWNKDKIKSMHF
jgi:IS1 family transposase